MGKHRPLPPFFGGVARTQLLIALAVKGPLTVDEIMRLTNMPRRIVETAGESLESRGIMTSYRWGCIERHRKIQRKMWALDRRHPWHLQMKNLGRRLSIGFPLPGTVTHPTRRTYRGSKGPLHRPNPIANLFGTLDEHRIVMLLAHTGESGQRYPIQTLGRRLGIGYTSVNAAVNHLERLGVVVTRWHGKKRLVWLDRRFPTWREIRRLAHRMDRACGNGQYAALARLHLWDKETNRRRQRHRRKTQKISRRRPK